LILFLLAGHAHGGDYTDTGPLNLLITYRCEPADRPAFRAYLKSEGIRRFEEWKKEGVFEEYRFFFNWYVDEGTWDAMVMVRFREWTDVAGWKKIEESFPGGLSRAGLRFAEPLVTTSADVVWQKTGDGEPPDRKESVFPLLRYEYLGLVSEYKAYVDGYVIPQLDGWIDAGVLGSYQVLLNRFPTGDRWGSLLVLEYKDLESFGRRKHTKYKVREGLRENPEWKAYSDRKRTIRREKEPVITELLHPY
jgi:hypothetical protein